MTKRQAENWRRVCDRLGAYGIEPGDINSLRRIEMTLSRWGEQECGDSNAYCSWAIERDEVTDKPYHVTRIHSENKSRRYAIPDREKGALRRLDAIMSKYPHLAAYHQTDPRGCSLYIIAKTDLPEGRTSAIDGRTRLQSAEVNYTHGVAVCY